MTTIMPSPSTWCIFDAPVGRPRVFPDDPNRRYQPAHFRRRGPALEWVRGSCLSLGSRHLGAPAASAAGRPPYGSGPFAGPAVDPQEGGHRLGVGELAVADHAQRVVEGPHQGLQELPL